MSDKKAVPPATWRPCQGPPGAIAMSAGRGLRQITLTVVAEGCDDEDIGHAAAERALAARVRERLTALAGDAPDAGAELREAEDALAGLRARVEAERAQPPAPGLTPLEKLVRAGAAAQRPAGSQELELAEAGIKGLRARHAECERRGRALIASVVQQLSGVVAASFREKAGASLARLVAGGEMVPGEVPAVLSAVCRDWGASNFLTRTPTDMLAQQPGLRELLPLALRAAAAQAAAQATQEPALGQDDLWLRAGRMPFQPTDPTHTGLPVQPLPPVEPAVAGGTWRGGTLPAATSPP